MPNIALLGVRNGAMWYVIEYGQSSGVGKDNAWVLFTSSVVIAFINSLGNAHTCTFCNSGISGYLPGSRVD